VASSSTLFTPLAIGKLSIGGRIIKTATSETRATPDGFTGQLMIDFYEPMARGGVPLIITGNLYTSLDGKATPMQGGVDADDKIPGLTRLVEAVHAHGGRIFAQINHAGRQVIPSFAGIAEATSASDTKDLFTGTRPRPLGVAEIERIVRQFGDAAVRCQAAGFDGVQIHAAHGYLINQFLTPYTNRRGDDYGGSFDKRFRFLREVYREVRARVGGDYPVIVKLNGSDWLPLRPGLKTPELVEIAKALESEGVDAVEVSVGHYESGFPNVRGMFGRCLRLMLSGGVRHLSPLRKLSFNLFWPVMALVSNVVFKRREGFNLDYARQFKQALKVPVICVGGFLTKEAMTRAIDGGSCDAVSLGRGFIANPYLVRQLRDGTPGPRCVDCNACVGVIGVQPVDCYHPRVRAEKDALLECGGKAAAFKAAPDGAALRH